MSGNNVNKPIIIYLSFKNELSDLELYNWVVSHSNKSGFIKDILRQARVDELSKNTESYTKISPSNK